MSITIGKTTALIKFFREGHTKDNLVGYNQEEHTLFASCLVKALKTNKGYLVDATLLDFTAKLFSKKK